MILWCLGLACNTTHGIIKIPGIIIRQVIRMAKKPYSQKISDILLKYGMIEEEALRSAEQEAQTSGTRLEKVLIDKKMVKSEDMTLALSEYLKMPPIILSHFTPSQMILDLIPKDVMAKRLIIPIAQVGKTLTMAL